MSQQPTEWALITGASSGIGYELAKCFARDGISLVLVARHEDQLRTVQHELTQQFGIEVTYQALDLSEAGQATALYTWCQTQPFDIRYLVNNAGLGPTAPWRRPPRPTMRICWRSTLRPSPC